MAEGRAVELAFRLGMTAVAVVGPTLLYFGLLRFLRWLQDDDLVETLARRGVAEPPDPSPVDVLARSTGGTECRHCGTVNVRGTTVCRECLSPLE
jgi:hypothetical protein